MTTVTVVRLVGCGVRATARIERSPIPRLLVAVLLTVVAVSFLPLSLPLPLKCALVFCVAILHMKRAPVEESALLLPSVGLQRESDFVHWRDIDDVVIKEVLSSHRVSYRLTVVARKESGEKYHLPLFPRTEPRLESLEFVYREFHRVLSCG